MTISLNTMIRHPQMRERLGIGKMIQWKPEDLQHPSLSGIMNSAKCVWPRNRIKSNENG